MRDFKFTKKESYTSEDLDLILEQHSSFVKGASKKELDEASARIKELEDKNKEYTTKERNSLLKGVAEKVSKDHAEKLMKYSRVTDEMTDEEIEKVMKDTAEDLGYIKSEETVSTTQPKVETQGKPITTVEQKASEKELEKFKGL